MPVDTSRPQLVAGGWVGLACPTEYGGQGLPGTLTLLSDAGFDDAAALRWLFTADDTLPGTPIQALRENRGTEIRRRAQALAF